MKLIKLTKGQYAKVDNEDYDRLNKFKWYYSKPYAARTINTKTANGYIRTKIRMHRAIMGLESTRCTFMVDHINQDTLDNTRENLRLCNYSTNMANRGKQANNTSGYKGVYKMREYWWALIVVDSKRISLGTYKTKIEAARAYNTAAKQHFGEYAYINPI